MSNNLASVGNVLGPSKGEQPTPDSSAESPTEQQSHPSLSTHQEIEPAIEEKLSSAEQQASTTSGPEPKATELKQYPTREDTLTRATTGDKQAQPTAMQHVLPDEYTYLRPKRGEIRQGRIMDIRKDSILVDLGLKREAIIPAEDMQRVGSSVVASASVGDEIPVYILRPEGGTEGSILVSWYRARQEQDWLDAQQLYESGEIWEGKVKGYNRGGLIVPFGKIRGFVPASQITGISRNMNAANLQERLAKMVGQNLHLKVIEVDRQNRRLIFSERTAQREWRTQQREKLLNELQEGDRLRGVVSSICDFGIFVDLGGTDGLVHISELSWHRTKHPSDLVKIGDEVEVYVLRVDRENKRIGLSLRLTEPDPWLSATEKYKVGQLVTGTVTKLTNFGAFAVLDDGIEGLIHISGLAEVPPKHPSEVVKTGDVLPLRIVKIDIQRRRMGLSLKDVSEEERAAWEEQHKTETTGVAEPSEEPQEQYTSTESMPVEPSDEIPLGGPPPDEEDTDNGY